MPSLISWKLHLWLAGLECYITLLASTAAAPPVQPAKNDPKNERAAVAVAWAWEVGTGPQQKPEVPTPRPKSPDPTLPVPILPILPSESDLPTTLAPPGYQWQRWPGEPWKLIQLNPTVGSPSDPISKPRVPLFPVVTPYATPTYSPSGYPTPFAPFGHCGPSGCSTGRSGLRLGPR